MAKHIRVHQSRPSGAVVDLSKKRDFEQIGVSISLKHYQRGNECFSDWDRDELKRFGKLIEKLRGLTLFELMRNSQLCERHGTQKKPDRFGRPSGIPTEKPFYELKVDANNLCRLHGVFDGSVFHLVYLDKKHKAFGI